MDRYDKLVRDDVPAATRANDEDPVAHEATGGEYRRRLHEEVAEFHADPSVDELADVREVLAALREHHGLDEAEVAERRREKAAGRGRFAEGVVLEAVER